MSRLTSQALFDNYLLASKMAGGLDLPVAESQPTWNTANRSATLWSNEDAKCIRRLYAVVSANVGREMSMFKLTWDSNPVWDINKPSEALLLLWCSYTFRAKAIDSLQKYFEPTRVLDRSAVFDSLSEAAMGDLFDYSEQNGLRLGNLRDQVVGLRSPTKPVDIPESWIVAGTVGLGGVVAGRIGLTGIDVELNLPQPWSSKFPPPGRFPFFAKSTGMWSPSGDIGSLLFTVDHVRKAKGSSFLSGVFAAQKTKIAMEAVKEDAEQLDQYLQEMFERNMADVLDPVLQIGGGR